MSDTKYRDRNEDYYFNNVAESITRLKNMTKDGIVDGIKDGTASYELLQTLTLGGIFDTLSITNMLLARILENVEPETKQPLDIKAAFENEKV